MKFRKYNIIILVFIFLVSCKESTKKNENRSDIDLDIRENDIEERKPDNYIYSQPNQINGLSKELFSLLNEYSLKYPIKEIKPDNQLVKQSYYVSFFKVENDTMLAICRQPFVFELFPEYGFTKDEKPNLTPSAKGIIKDSDLPIIIFDIAENLGVNFYDSKFLNKEIPEEYFTGKDKIHDTIIPEIYKYKLKNNTFSLIGKSKEQWID